MGHASKLVDLAVPQDQGTGKKRTPCGCIQPLWGSGLEHAERCDGREPGSPRTKARAQQAGGSHPRMLNARCTGRGPALPPARTRSGPYGKAFLNHVGRGHTGSGSVDWVGGPTACLASFQLTCLQSPGSCLWPEPPPLGARDSGSHHSPSNRSLRNTKRFAYLLGGWKAPAGGGR